MDKVTKVILVSFFGNILLIAIKLVTGIITNTHIIVADAMHSFADLITDVIAFIGQKISNRKHNKKHPKGHGKFEYVTSLGISGLIILLALSLAYNALVSPNADLNNNVLIIVVITIILKFFISKHLYHFGKKYNNNILISSAIEGRSDVLSSFAVLISIVAFNFADYFPILRYSDTIGTLIISYIILKTGLTILRENLSLIIGENESNEEIIDSVKNIILNIEEVCLVNDLILIKNGSYYDCTIKIAIDEKKTIDEAHEIEKRVRLKLRRSKFNIKYVHVSMNPYKY